QTEKAEMKVVESGVIWPCRVKIRSFRGLCEDHASPPAPLCSRSNNLLRLSARQKARTDQEFVDGACALSAFADRPDDQRLAAPHVAGGEELGDRGAVVDRAGADIATGIQLDTGLLDHPWPARPKKAHRQ